MKNYIVNKNSSFNPGYHHEVHTEEHARDLCINSFFRLGAFSDEKSAVNFAKAYYYPDADGCAKCCPKAHEG